MRRDESNNNTTVCVPSWAFHDILAVLNAVASLPDRWLEPCPFTANQTCTDHLMPSCPRQRAMLLLGELSGLHEEERASA